MDYSNALIFIAVEENKEKIQSTAAPSFPIYGKETQKVTCPKSQNGKVGK